MTSANPLEQGIAPLLGRLSSTQRVWVLTGALAATGVILVMVVATVLPQSTAGLDLPWWTLVVAFALAEIFVVHVRFMQNAHTLSMSEVPLVVGLLSCSPPKLVLAQLIGAGLALVLHRRQSPIKVAFNLAQWSVTTSISAIVFTVLVRLGEPLGPAGWLAAFCATITADVVAGATINVAISISEGTRLHFPHMGVGTVAVIANTSLGLVAATVLWWQPEAAWLLLSLAAIVFLAYRAYVSVMHKHESMRLLYEATRVGQESLKMEPMLLGLLSHAREMFRAEIAEIDLFSPDQENVALRTSIGPAATTAMKRVELDPRRGVWARVASEGDALLLRRPIENVALRVHFAERWIRDAMVAPIKGGEGIVGTMLVANRLGDFSTFDADDLNLFETLANHISISLENGRLVHNLQLKAEENERLALHDVLTGLPNRMLFHESLRRALDDAGATGSMVAVMLMDLDRFKEVNDTLGHHNGDLLLKEVGNRLLGTTRRSDVVARLGGDEFAVLVPGISDPEAARAIARKLLEALEQPLQLEELTLDVGASIGIALFPQDGNDAETLLQKADVAMYGAKEAHSGLDAYSHDKDRYSPDRLALVAELRRAIDNGELSLVFQPKIDLHDGTIAGFEALARWHHARRGFVPPDQFVPIAEHTGLIVPLTELVLDRALQQCGEWLLGGMPHEVSVNLSARSLLNAQLPEQVEHLLKRWSVPPRFLKLEITESSLLVDPERSAGILRRLAQMGVALSIDDYGTGYSSLSHLRRLPVSEIKIDKSFVMEMTAGSHDAAIVRSTVELGHILGMRVVAEGVESHDIAERLKALGCDEAQGYHFSRPLDREDVIAWVQEQYPGSGRQPAQSGQVVPLKVSAQ